MGSRVDGAFAVNRVQRNLILPKPNLGLPLKSTVFFSFKSIKLFSWYLDRSVCNGALRKKILVKTTWVTPTQTG